MYAVSAAFRSFKTIHRTFASTSNSLRVQAPRPKAEREVLDFERGTVVKNEFQSIIIKFKIYFIKPSQNHSTLIHIGSKSEFCACA